MGYFTRLLRFLLTSENGVMRKLNFDIYGLRGLFQTSIPQVYEFVKDSLDHFISDIPEHGLQVVVDFSCFAFKQRTEILSGWLEGTKQISGVGKDVFIKNRDIVTVNFHNHQLAVRVTLKDKQLSAQGAYFVQKKEVLEKIFFQKKIYDLALLNAIKRSLIHYPLFLSLEDKKSIFFMQAGGVEKDGKGFIFMGLPGCGKTTIVAALLREKGVRFISDNFLPYDKERLYAFPESFRIRDKVEAKGAIRGSPFLSAGHKGLYKVKQPLISGGAYPHRIFLLRFAKEDHCERISPQRAYSSIVAMEKTMKEFRDYAYLKLLELGNNDNIPAGLSREGCLLDLLNRTEAFILNLKKGQLNKDFIFKAMGS